MEKLLNSPGFVALVSTFGTIVVAYIANVVAKKRRASKPPDRMATIFNGYEKLIFQQQEEIQRKAGTISTLEIAVDQLDRQLTETKHLLAKARDDLKESTQNNKYLKDQLESMRNEYRIKGNDA